MVNIQVGENSNNKEFKEIWKETMVANDTINHFVGSNLGVKIFLKKREHQKKSALKERIEAPLWTLYWGFKKIPCKACLLFFCFLVIKRILKPLFSFTPWLLNSSDLPRYGSNSRERNTPRLLPICLWMSIPHIGGKALPPFGPLFTFLRRASFSLVLHLRFS